MLKTINLFTLCLLSSLFSQAQDTGKTHYNLRVSYHIGLQFFGLQSAEQINHQNLAQELGNTPGFIHNKTFGPTLLHQVSVSAATFKNKTWRIGLAGGWGKNEITSYAYKADANKDLIIEYKSITEYKSLLFGYYFQKDLLLKKWGAVSVLAGFNPLGTFTAETGIIINEKNSTSGALRTMNYNASGNYTFGTTREGVLMLFDNPKIGIEYSVKLYGRMQFTAHYSYLWGNTMINDFYGISNRFVIPFRDSKSRFPSRNRAWRKDFWGSNLSVGISVKLSK